VKFIEGKFLLDYQHADLTNCPIYTGNSRHLQLFIGHYMGIFRTVRTVRICPDSGWGR
jgi:hypothetical protein